jgi:hypothetical protein
MEVSKDQAIKEEKRKARLLAKQAQLLESQQREEEARERERLRLEKEVRECRKTLKGAKLRYECDRSMILAKNTPGESRIFWNEKLYLLGKNIWILYQEGEVPIFDEWDSHLNHEKKMRCLFKTEKEVSRWISEAVKHPTEQSYLRLRFFGDEDF